MYPLHCILDTEPYTIDIVRYIEDSKTHFRRDTVHFKLYTLDCAP